ncbi:MAG: hypothetical protein J6M62_03995 [Selenomonadaceae bacterium]|nr:hypothetical protein [Selenomonadaceae bacterium]
MALTEFLQNIKRKKGGCEKTKKLQNKIKRRRDFAGVLLFSVKLYFYKRTHIKVLFLFSFSFSFKKREKKEKEVFSQPLFLLSCIAENLTKSQTINYNKSTAGGKNSFLKGIKL